MNTLTITRNNYTSENEYLANVLKAITVLADAGRIMVVQKDEYSYLIEFDYKDQAMGGDYPVWTNLYEEATREEKKEEGRTCVAIPTFSCNGCIYLNCDTCPFSNNCDKQSRPISCPCWSCHNCSNYATLNYHPPYPQCHSCKYISCEDCEKHDDPCGCICPCLNCTDANSFTPKE